MEFRICFSISKYENNIFLICETSNEFQNPFSSVRTIRIDQNNVETFSLLLGLSPVWNRFLKGGHTTWATKHSIIMYDEIEDRICKE